ncbi:MAG: DNA helicase UvrD, partial [Collinsella sp.]|nr:DNA helicase UvrD [Collinsella sp.]
YGTERHRGVSPDAGRVASTFGSGASRAKKSSSKVSPTVERKVDRASASQDFAAGDTVSHKTFGTGTVISVAGDMIEVQFEKTGQTKKLMKGFAPIVKLNA